MREEKEWSKTKIKNEILVTITEETNFINKCLIGVL